MIRTTLLLLALAALPAAARPDGDLDKLQGTWVAVEFTRDGKALRSDQVEGRVLVIERDTFTDRQGKTVLGKGTITLDATKLPRTIDATFTEGFPKGMTSRGIYELDGDTLKTCAGKVGGERPAGFESKAGSGSFLVLYRRVKGR
jgi:uncharacterized protein (TIGR03067 family)